MLNPYNLLIPDAYFSFSFSLRIPVRTFISDECNLAEIQYLMPREDAGSNIHVHLLMYLHMIEGLGKEIRFSPSMVSLAPFSPVMCFDKIS